MRPAFAVSRVACDDEHARDDGCAYRVAWTINPHMRPGRSDACRAERQLAAFTRALRAAGAKVLELPFVHGCFDSVFVKDCAVLVEERGARRTLLARPRYGERAPEQEHRARQLEAAGFRVQPAPAHCLEGGDVVLLPGGRGALLGCGPRSEAGAKHALERFLGVPVTTLRLRDEAFFHLDTCVGVLRDGTALVADGALCSRSEEALARLPSIRRVVRLPREEAMCFATNFIEVGSAVLLHEGARGTVELLRALGRRPVPVDLREFLFAGGSAACLAAPVHVLDAREARREARQATDGRAAPSSSPSRAP